MKSIVIALSLLLFFASSRGDVVEKTFQFGEPEIKVDNGYTFIEFENTRLSGVPGEPALPYLAVKMLLPPGQIAKDIEIIFGTPVSLDGTFEIYPVQPSRPLSEGSAGEFRQSSKVYESEGPWPGKPHGIVTTQFLNGYSVAMTTLTPLQYYPASGKVIYHKEITVRITTTAGSSAENALMNLPHHAGAVARVQRLVDNPSEIINYPGPERSQDDYQLLIITTSQFSGEFGDLVDLYLARGIKTELVTTQEIGSLMTGQDLQEKIRNYIIQEYQDHGIQFVLLGGDVEHVPYRGFYCYVDSGSGYEDDGIPADLYYSALDGTWNDDGDNRWGEPGEDDLLPEVGVARYTVSSSTDLENMMHKSVSYQDSPVAGELRDPLLAGEHLWNNPETWGADYLDLLIGFHNANGYTTVGIPTDHNIDSLYERSGSWGGSDLKAKLNEGKSFLHHSGHANETYVAHLNSGDITNSSFYGLNGTDHNYTLMFTHGCNCGSFDYSDCILERMVNIENFAVAVIGNSRYGWFNEGQTEGPAAHLHREFVDALYNEKIHQIGLAFVEMKTMTAPWVTAPGQWEEGALRWNFYDINIMGDPAMGVWTDEPVTMQAAYQNAIPIGSPGMEVTVTSAGTQLEDYTCTVIKDGMIHGTAKTNASGVAWIEFDPVFTQIGAADLVVSGYNCIPEYFDLNIIPNTGSYVIYASHDIDDSAGNNDGEPDFGESIALGMELQNVGTQQAGDVQVNLSTADTYITITDGFENYGDIPGESFINVPAAFAFDIADNIPDQHMVLFELEIASGANSWNSSFTIIVNAPQLSIGTISVDDFAGGNGDGILDPGETADIIIVSSNTGHCACQDATGEISSSCQEITVNTSNCNLGELLPGESAQAVFNITVSPDAPIGSSVDINHQLSSGSYVEQKIFYLTVGLIFEDFETGDFSAFEWESGGNAPWTITSTNPYEGTYCAKSGNINDNQSTTLYVTMDVLSEDTISFYRKVSSEGSYDYLRFYIDNTMKAEWSGEKSWEKVEYVVPAGLHTFKWEYEKDWYVSSGQDCGWIDYIVFPGVSNAANPLNVTVSADPDEVCMGNSSQLHAWATGGTGNYNYEWTPTTGLSDPNIYNPVATPQETTLYTVTINDGNETVSADVTVTVFPVPETPIINQEDNYLYSSAAEGNQWYDSNGPVPGATGQVFYPEATDYYYTIVTNQYGCGSNQSNVIYFILTGAEERLQDLVSLYPNPTAGRIYIQPENTNGFLEVDIRNSLNELILSARYDTGKERTGIDLSNHPAGLYFIIIRTEEGSIAEKIILE